MPEADASDLTELAGVAEMATESVEAWSVDDETVEFDSDRASWRRVAAVVGVMVVVAAVVVGGVVAWDRHQSPAVGAAKQSRPPMETAWRLDGTYRVDIRNGEGTLRDGHSGALTPMGDFDVPTATKWVAYKTECEPSDCVARSMLLDDVSHRNVAPADESGDPTGQKSAMLRWNGTEWVSVGGPGIHGGREVQLGCANGPGVDVWEVWTTLSPLPDGSFGGTSHRSATTNGCGVLGDRQEVPVEVVRVGDAPAGIFQS